MYYDIQREVVELFHNMVRIVDRRVMLMVFDRDTFVIHMPYFPSLLGRSAKTRRIWLPHASALLSTILLRI